MDDALQDGRTRPTTAQHEERPSTVVPLNHALGEQLTAQQRELVVRTILECARLDDEQAVAQRLTATFDEVGAHQPEKVVTVMAENLSRATGEVYVTDSDGSVLSGPEDWTPSTITPHLSAEDDPAGPDRPVYS